MSCGWRDLEINGCVVRLSASRGCGVVWCGVVWCGVVVSNDRYKPRYHSKGRILLILFKTFKKKENEDYFIGIAIPSSISESFPRMSYIRAGFGVTVLHNQFE